MERYKMLTYSGLTFMDEKAGPATASALPANCSRRCFYYSQARTRNLDQFSIIQSSGTQIEFTLCDFSTHFQW